MGEIRVGTASWTDKTLLASGWYPPEVDTPEARLKYYAERFPVVEVDSTYYTPPNERNSALWVARTPKDFRFNVKAFSLLTKHPTRPSALYKDLRPDTTKNVYVDDLPRESVDQVWERFLAALDPLHQAGKLGAVLFQFPHWFAISKANKAYILECKERAAPYPLCVEFRSATWFRDDENTKETLEFLASYAVPFVCVDMPQGYRSSIPPVLAATAPDLAVVRFHGHSGKWESKDIYERFGYLYDEAQLRPWVPKLQELAQQVQEAHVLMNNCYRNYAQVNAQQLAGLLHT